MNRIVGVSLALITAACNATPAPRLPAAEADFRHVDNTFVFTLPDSCGFLINGQVVARGEVPAQVAALFAPRPNGMRAIMVWDNPARRADAQWLARVAIADSGRAFDAEMSGWPREMGPPQ